jgi:hypothetical protein
LLPRNRFLEPFHAFPRCTPCFSTTKYTFCCNACIDTFAFPNGCGRFSLARPFYRILDISYFLLSLLFSYRYYITVNAFCPLPFVS